MDKNKKKRDSVVLLIAVLAVLGFGSAFAYNAHRYFTWWQDGQRAQEIGRVMREMILDAVPLDDVRELTGNSDIVAFIHIEGTNISNAVAQGRDNDFYLHHDVFGESNVNGAIFMDFRNNSGFTDRNTVLYGHNMRNTTMFHNLRYYMDRDFFEAHPHIEIITDSHVLTYEIFSTFAADVDFYYIRVDFDSEREFAELVDEITRRRLFETGVDFESGDRMLILSTCTNIDAGTRYVVAARLMRTGMVPSLILQNAEIC
jgi:sortase B